MSSFAPRPKGTLVSGRFVDRARAERALRVLRNAGYARAEVVDNPEALPGAPVLLVIDAAATGAARAAEILEAHGAQTTIGSQPARVPEPERPDPAQVRDVGEARDFEESVTRTASQARTPFERKPRVRKKNRDAFRSADMPLGYDDIIIVTRGIDSFRSEAGA